MAGEGEDHRIRTAVGYLATLAVAGAMFLWIRSLGVELVAPPPLDGQPAAAPAKFDALFHVLLALAVVIPAARTLGYAFRWLRQPQVMGEVVAGLLLGPSFLGQVSPATAAYLLPAEVAPFLGVIAQVGVILYMFLVGLELDLSSLRRSSRAAIAISHASIVFPFLLGSALALALYPLLSNSAVPFTVFALFMGVSMSVTAFPVLARILTDRGLQRGRIGSLALACAAVDDVTAWCLLALIVGVARPESGSGVGTVVLTILYVAFVFAVLRPALARLTRRFDGQRSGSQGALALALILLLVSALTTEAIGIHAIFGAFLAGAVIPHESVLTRDLTHRLGDLIAVLLLPAFFAFTGMRTQVGLVSGAGEWMLVGAIIVVASLGKFGGSLIAARVVGLGWRESSAMGILMNTRGLMELIVLNVGLDLNVISPTLFAMLVLMAITTTLVTTPILDALNRDGRLLD